MKVTRGTRTTIKIDAKEFYDILEVKYGPFPADSHDVEVKVRRGSASIPVFGETHIQIQYWEMETKEED